MFKSADGHVEVSSERVGEKERLWKSRRAELVVKHVCRQCNNGWMSGIEDEVRDQIIPLLKGFSVEIPKGKKGLIAKWAMKTAMVLEAVGPKDGHVYTQEEREVFAKSRSMPWRTTIWISAVAEATYLYSAKKRHLSPLGTNVSGVTITMAFGHLALQVLTMRVPGNVGPETMITADVRQGEWDDATIKIYPEAQMTIAWPTKVGLNGQNGIDALADRFIVGEQWKGNTMAICV